MHLRHDGDGAVRGALDHPHLPEGDGAVHLLARDVAAQVGELLAAAGAGHRDPVHVPVDVELGVVDPDRVVEVQHGVVQFPPEDGHALRPGGELRLEGLEVVPARDRRDVEDDQPADVQELGGCLEIEER